MVKKMCATGTAFNGKSKVSKAVQAAACAAVAAWERKKAKASDDSCDDAIIELSGDNPERLHMAELRKIRRGKGKDITDAINLSDDEYFRHVTGEELDEGEGVIELADVDSFVKLLEMSETAQSAVRFPLNLSEAVKGENGKYLKEILRVGEIIVDATTGKKFNFTTDFLKKLKRNFDMNVLDYVPLLYTDDKNRHSSSANPNAYGGTITQLSLDDEESPTKLYGEFNLTEEAAKVVEHNNKFGVSVTAHPNYVDSSGEYYGPVLLDVNATHRPKLAKLSDWSKIEITASDEKREFGVLDLSDSSFVETINDDKKVEVDDMTEVKDEVQPMELSAEQIKMIMESDAFKEQVELSVADVKTENENLRKELNNQKRESYETIVKSAVATYRNNGENSVPPVLCDYAESLLLSFDETERNEIIELSVGDEEKKLSKVEIVTKMLEETKGFMDLGKERGSTDDTVELSKEENDEAVNYLVSLAKANL